MIAKIQDGCQKLLNRHILAYARTDVMKFQIRVYGPKLENSIDPAIVCKSCNWHSFKKLYKKYLLSKYIWWLIIF